jgi:hypothetical protein
MSLRRAWLSAGLSACCACNGVGRALVDYEPPGEAEMTICSAMRCEGVLPVLAVPDTPGEYGDLSLCEPPTMQTVHLTLDDCRCRSLELDLAESALPVELAGPEHLEHCRLHLRSERPIEVRLAVPRLDDVHIALEGPIKLTMRNVVRGQRVSVAASAEHASIELERCDLSLFSLHDPEQRISALNVSHSTLVSALIEIANARFDSVAVRRSTLIARTLDADDLDALHSRLEVDQALISSSRMNEVELSACRQLRILGSELSFVEATCRERIQLYSTRAQQSVFDGPIEFDAAELLNSSFGLSESTSLVAFESSFTNANLCEHVRDARFRGGFASCVDCEGPLMTGEAFLCGERTFSSTASENPCPAVASIQTCVSFPDRPRPH